VAGLSAESFREEALKHRPFEYDPDPWLSKPCAAPGCDHYYPEGLTPEAIVEHVAEALWALVEDSAKWGVYLEEHPWSHEDGRVYVYRDEGEARRQLGLAQMDIYATLARVVVEDS
jgi:hypothetical protein